MAVSYLSGATVLAFLFALAFTPIAHTLAKFVNLVDEPGGRKSHEGRVPLAGGIVIFAGLSCATLFLHENSKAWAIVISGAPLFLLGIIDDRFDLTARVRILAQLGIGLMLVFGFGINISQLDSVSGVAPILLAPFVATLFTLFCVCGVLNATNMADGIDGLLGSMACVSLMGIAMLCIGAHALQEAAISHLMLGLLAGFLAYNLGFFGAEKRVFLGDSGSMLIGLVLLVLLVDLSQKNSPVLTPTSAGWLLGLPLLDAVSVMARRVVQGRSPFTAGRDHFHHVLQDLGLSKTETLKLMIVLQFAFVAVGLFANWTEFPQYYFFWAFVVVTLTQFFSISSGVRLIAKGRVTEDSMAGKALSKSTT